MLADYWNEGTFKPNTLVIHPGRAEKVTIKAGGGILKRGTVLGRVAADRKYLPSLGAASDGSQVPEAILSGDVDATAADAEVIAYVTGTYNSNVVVIGAGHTLDSVRDAFRSKQIYLEATLRAG